MKKKIWRKKIEFLKEKFRFLIEKFRFLKEKKLVLKKKFSQFGWVVWLAISNRNINTYIQYVYMSEELYYTFYLIRLDFILLELTCHDD